MPEFDTVDLHLITERADGPDFDDLVRLIRYCREHELCVSVNDSQPLSWDDKVGQFAVRLYGPQPAIVLWEGDPAPRGAHFVGPDGTVYDANREVL
jgi:hypothetical protein